MFYIEENRYSETMASVVEPKLEQYRTNNTFKGVENVNIYYNKFLAEKPKAIVVICHGFCESIEKYNEFIYYLNEQGYSVYALDHRGHGHSDHIGCDETQVHVENFNNYVMDLKIFMDEVVVPETNNLTKFLFAHSMGGCIGGLFLEQHPGYFKAAILNAPMMEIHTGKYPAWIAKTIATLFVKVGKQKQYLLGHSPFKGIVNVADSGTSSEVRYMYYHQKRLKNISFQTDGGSFGWLYESFKATKQLIQNADKIKIPLVLFQAENDTFVKPNGHIKFAQKAPNCKVYFVEKAKHEIYFEQDAILMPYLKQVFNFYNEQLKS
ncbi:MAG: lysophospholipase [Bacillaceae bacterium]